jgi:hypothetical protein
LQRSNSSILGCQSARPHADDTSDAALNAAWMSLPCTDRTVGDDELDAGFFLQRFRLCLDVAPACHGRNTSLINDRALQRREIKRAAKPAVNPERAEHDAGTRKHQRKCSAPLGDHATKLGFMGSA